MTEDATIAPAAAALADMTDGVRPAGAPDFDAAVREHGRMVARICASYESDRGLAEELHQDILLALWRALPTHRGESSLRTFIARIAHNRAVTHVAKRAKQPLTAELSEEIPCVMPPPEQAIVSADQREKLLAAVRALPLQFRQPVMLTLEGFTPAEMTDVLGLAPSVISVRLTRAKALLRTLLNAGQS